MTNQNLHSVFNNSVTRCWMQIDKLLKKKKKKKKKKKAVVERKELKLKILSCRLSVGFISILESKVAQITRLHGASKRLQRLVKPWHSCRQEWGFSCSVNPNKKQGFSICSFGMNETSCDREQKNHPKPWYKKMSTHCSDNCYETRVSHSPFIHLTSGYDMRFE